MTWEGRRKEKQCKNMISGEEKIGKGTWRSSRGRTNLSRSLSPSYTSHPRRDWPGSGFRKGKPIARTGGRPGAFRCVHFICLIALSRHARHTIPHPFHAHKCVVILCLGKLTSLSKKRKTRIKKYEGHCMSWILLLWNKLGQSILPAHTCRHGTLNTL